MRSCARLQTATIRRRENSEKSAAPQRKQPNRHVVPAVARSWRTRLADPAALYQVDDAEQDDRADKGNDQAGQGKFLN